MLGFCTSAYIHEYFQPGPFLCLSPRQLLGTRNAWKRCSSTVLSPYCGTAGAAPPSTCRRRAATSACWGRCCRQLPAGTQPLPWQTITATHRCTGPATMVNASKCSSEFIFWCWGRSINNLIFIQKQHPLVVPFTEGEKMTDMISFRGMY